MSISFPSADFAPTLSGYTGQGPFRFWCQKVLPIVYDDSLSYYELLNKVVNYLNNVIADVGSVEENIGKLNDSYVDLQNYVNEHMQELVEVVNIFTSFVETYFDNLDVQEEINSKLDSMVVDGSLASVIEPIVSSNIAGPVASWLSENLDPSTNPVLDTSLEIQGTASDSRVTGRFKQELGIEVLTVETGNFTGETFENVENSRVDLCRSDILYGIGPCVIKTSLPGLRIVCYSKNTVSGNIIETYDGISFICLPKQYNCCRIRVQPGETSITDFTSYTNGMLIIENKGNINAIGVGNSIDAITKTNGLDISWEHGHYNAADGSIVDSSFGLRTQLFDYNENYRVVFSSKIRGYLNFYDADDNFINTNAAWTDFSTAFDGTGFIELSDYSFYSPSKFGISCRATSNIDLTNEIIANITKSIFICNNDGSVIKNLSGLFETSDITKLVEKNTLGDNLNLELNYGLYLTTNGLRSNVKYSLCSNNMIEYNPDYVIMAKGVRGYITLYDENGNYIPVPAVGWDDLTESRRLDRYATYNPKYFNVSIRIGTSNVDLTKTEIEFIIDNVKLYDSSNSIIGVVNANTRELLLLQNVVLTELTEYSCALINGIEDNIVVECYGYFTGTGSNEYVRPTLSARSGLGSYSQAMGICDRTPSIRRFRLYPAAVPRDNLTLRISCYGLTVYIQKLRVFYDNNIDRTEKGVVVESHGGMATMPPYGYRALNRIIRVGATHCVELPKRSSDGVWFSYHDDTFDESTTFLRDANGNTIVNSPYNGEPFAEIPFSYLESLDWGVSTAPQYKGDKPLKIDEFFYACSKTGVHPMLSFHPTSTLSVNNLTEIKQMARRRNVLNWLGVKIPFNPTTISNAISVMGTEIESYTINARVSDSVASVIEYVDTLNIDTSKVKVIIELFANSSYLTPENINAIINAGYYAGVANATHNRVNGTSGDLNVVDYDYYSSLGVKYFTSPHFVSFGLNW